MKIITNIALAACVGLSLGCMSSCTTERTVTETTTSEAPPPPALLTSAPVVTEPAVVVSPNASTASTTTEFNNGTVEQKNRHRVQRGLPAASSGASSGYYA